MTILESLTYNPTELNFGTSGLRGLVTDITDLESYINTIGFIRFLEQYSNLPKTSTISVGGDLRESTPKIIIAVAKAIEDCGHKVDYCGLLPTPALAFWAQENQQPCIMATGSHIPADRNGIKFYKASGEVLKSDEENIKSSVSNIRSELYQQSVDESIFLSNGSFKEPPENLPDTNDQALQAYKKRYNTMFNEQFLVDKKIVVYQHSAVGRDMLVELLQNFGAQVEAVDRSDIFVPIDTENVTPENQVYFKSLAEKYPDCFAIVSTDGDSDRPFVIDENGEFHRGDVLGFVVARELSADFAALPITSSDAVDSSLKKTGITYKHTRVGSPYVLEAMSNSDATLPVGWEVNGGFLIGNDFDYAGKHVEKLPTRDAFLPIFVCLKAATKAQKSVSQLFSELPARYTQAGLIDNFPIESSQAILAAFTDPVKALELVSSVFTHEVGFDVLAKVDTTDGVRLYFQNDNIVHIRPSGNAPQLRIYSIAGTQKRADEIVQLGLGDEGLLRKLQRII